MIAPESLFDGLRRRGIGMFVGVPDSLLKSFCAYVADHGSRSEHIIAANEGNAVAIAVGYHLATGKLGAVYLQNSGLGNTINPLTSLADADVYRVPLLLIIGWRGEPGVKDEPQHVKQGRITKAQLDLLEIPYQVLQADSDVDAVLESVFESARTTNAPVALLVRQDTFSNYKLRQKASATEFQREDALRQLLALAHADDLFVSTTGKTSREVFELRVERKEAQRDFLTVGGMGHTSSIALGVALGNPRKRVICLDGDGSMLMHMGAMPIIGSMKPSNLIHVLLNNAAHESVGGQPTVAGEIDVAAIARATGYTAYAVATDRASLAAAWATLAGSSGPVLLEVRISIGSRDNLGRPSSTPEENKRAFMAAARD
jgi:phosphonopyruvate decarboxylase